MNIVILNDYAYLEGGASRIALHQTSELAARGHKVSLFAAMGDRGTIHPKGWVEGGEYPVWLTGQWDLAANTSRRKAAVQGIWNTVAARQLSSVLRGYSPDDTIVLAHSWTKALSSSVLHCAASLGYCVVAVLHEYFLACPNGAYHDFRADRHCWRTPMSMPCISANCDRRNYAHKLWRVTRQAVQKHFGHLPDCLSAVVCVSEYQRRVMTPWLPDDLLCHVLTNPVSQPPANLQAQPARNRAYVFVGRLSSEKGAQIFASAASKAGVQSVLVGDGEEYAMLHSRFPEVHMTGWLPANEIWQQLLQARALVFPSIWHETFGLSIYEAAALGVPAIVSDGTACTDFVRDGENGLVFRQGDEEDLAAKLRLLEQQPELAARLGQRARADFETYRADNVNYLGKLEGILDEALGRHNELQKAVVKERQLER